jgi:hypothetical protein
LSSSISNAKHCGSFGPIKRTGLAFRAFSVPLLVAVALTIAARLARLIR